MKKFLFLIVPTLFVGCSSAVKLSNDDGRGVASSDTSIISVQNIDYNGQQGRLTVFKRAEHAKSVTSEGYLNNPNLKRAVDHTATTSFLFKYELFNEGRELSEKVKNNLKNTYPLLCNSLKENIEKSEVHLKRLLSDQDRTQSSCSTSTETPTNFGQTYGPAASQAKASQSVTLHLVCNVKTVCATFYE